jgi:hypothetical protein
MTLNVLTWNSQGNKADAMWGALNDIGTPGGPAGYNPVPGVAPGGAGVRDDLLICVCESGTPPWISSGLATVAWGHVYGFRYGTNPGNHHPARPAAWLADPLPIGMAQALATWNGNTRRVADAVWIPWQVYVNAPPSLRCSLSMYWFPSRSSGSACEFGWRTLVEHDYAGRPVLTATITKGGRPRCVILFAHLPANQRTAAVALPELVARAHSVVPEGTKMLVAGDLNIDALVPGVARAATPRGWTPVLPGRATQNSGGALDWGIANDLLHVADPSMVWTCNGDRSAPPPGAGPSDHALLMYQVDVS